MKIEKHKVVSIHYTLTGDDGETIDSSEGGDPLSYISGAGNIIAGLDNALLGCEVGDKRTVTVQPQDAYGVVDESLVEELPVSMFTGVEKVEVGMEFRTQDSEGQVQHVEVVKVDGDKITVDSNHPLAGKVLNFDVSVVAVRDASDEEVNRGHLG